MARPDSLITPAQRRSYQRDGFLVIDGFFPRKRCDSVNRAIAGNVKGRYQNYLDLHDRVRSLRELMLDRRLLDTLDALQRHRMIPIGSVFFFCKPQNPLEQGSLPHQDNYAPKSPFGSYLVASVALDDADEENGALRVCPGSHTLGDLPCRQKKNFEFTKSGRIKKSYPVGNPCAIPKSHPEKVLAYSKGSLILLHAHTVHYAKRNESDRWRRQVYFHFIKNGHPFWPGWNAHRRLIDRPPSRVLGIKQI